MEVALELAPLVPYFVVVLSDMLVEVTSVIGISLGALADVNENVLASVIIDLKFPICI